MSSGGELLHPPVHAYVINDDAPVSEQFLHAAAGKSVAAGTSEPLAGLPPAQTGTQQSSILRLTREYGDEASPQAAGFRRPSLQQTLGRSGRRSTIVGRVLEAPA